MKLELRLTRPWARALTTLVCLALAPGLAGAAREERTTFVDVDALVASPLQSGPVRVRGCLFYTPLIGPHLFSDCDVLSVDVPVSVGLDFRKARPAIFRYKHRAFACVEFDGEWKRHPAPEIVAWTRDHGTIQATFAMRAAKGCAPLVAPAGLDAGIAAADLVVRFRSPDEAAIAIQNLIEHVAVMPATPRPRISARARAAVERWRGSDVAPVASAAGVLAELLPCNGETPASCGDADFDAGTHRPTTEAPEPSRATHRDDHANPSGH